MPGAHDVVDDANMLPGPGVAQRLVRYRRRGVQQQHQPHEEQQRPARADQRRADAERETHDDQHIGEDDRQRQDGVSPEVAIYEACLLRFRPIMMTTLAAVFGAVPLALSQGTGSELRQPLGITIIGGLVVSQILTLYTTPVIYLWFDWLSRAWGFDPAGLVQIPEPDDDRFSAVDAGEDLDSAGQAASAGGPA